MSVTKFVPAPSEYAAIFEAERLRSYPAIDAFEARCGYAIDRVKLETAARVLACPLKINPPNWQHGRVIYAATRRALAACDEQAVCLLDIGTAKGFSALCLEWARLDSGAVGVVHSVDVIDPASHTHRNTAAECDGPKTLAEILEPWPEAQAIAFYHDTGIDWLRRHKGRVHVAFVDGKHSSDVVREEGRLIASRQKTGDVAIFDDVQIDSVRLATLALETEDSWDFECIGPKRDRMYAIGVCR